MQIQEDLWDYLQNCIQKNYLLIIAITSYTQGKVKSENLPFGVGKTTCGMWFNAWMNNTAWKHPEHWMDNVEWEPTKKSMYYDYVKLIRRLKRFDGVRVNNALYDDAQMTAPATKNVDRKIYELAYYITGSRPEVATITFSCPNLLTIAAPLRNIVNVEVIVPERGIFEVQRIKNFKNFKKPRDDLSKLDYLEEGTFPELPPEMQRWYDDWRVEEKKLWHKKHPDVSGGDEEDEEPINITPDQSKILEALVRRGNIPSKQARNDGTDTAIQDLVVKGLARYSNGGYIIAPTKKGNQLIINQNQTQ